MKQQEKTQRTRERILSAAFAEFGAKRYEGASVNTICSESLLPKGLLYHNFKSKDELYLQCVKLCYDQMIEYFNSHETISHDAQEDMKSLLAMRQKFFSDNPYHASLFFYSLLQPPKHLIPLLKEVRRDFDTFCTKRYLNLLRGLPLRDGVTEEMALEYFSIFLEMFNGYFQSKAEQGGDYQALMEAHEEKLSAILDLMLYGIVKQNEKDR